jgi:DNA-binding PucR family transcriptional regulator
VTNPLTGSSKGVDLAPSISAVRVALADALRAQRVEIEEVIFRGVRSGADSFDETDGEYVAGLRATVSAIVDYGLAGIEQGGDWSAPIPSVAVEQVHRAARSGVGLETVLLRYAAGHRHLGRFVMAEMGRFPPQAVHDVLDFQALLLETLMERVSAEYGRELQRTARTLEQRRAERVRSLLAGEAGEPPELNYAFEKLWHLGVIARGARAREFVRGLESGSVKRLFLVVQDKESLWAWVGSESRSAVENLSRSLRGAATGGVSVALGEPSEGMRGWRLTHRQAQAALLIVLRGRSTIVRYTDHMLLVAVLQDPTLARSLEEIYLLPLASHSDGGCVWRATLRAYFDAQGNAATAAASLGVDRSTVSRRLHEIGHRLGRTINPCQGDLNLALRWHELCNAGGDRGTGSL